MVNASHTRHLLVVDDEADSADALAELLRLVLPRWDVAVAYAGSAAVERGRRGPLEVIVLDIEMPGLDGFAAAAALRAAAPGAALVLIAVSGNPSKVAAALASSVFDHALPKPVDLARLTALCEPP
jgi:two-component system response regulator DesR